MIAVRAPESASSARIRRRVASAVSPSSSEEVSNSGRSYALAAGAAEAGGGLLFALGAVTPLCAAAVCGSMITAIKTVHWAKGVWVSAGGYEYNLVLLAAVFGLTEN